MSSDRARNGQVIRRASPARDQSTLGKWRSTTGEAATCLSSNEKQTTLSPKTSSVTSISSDLNAYFHFNYLFGDRMRG